MNELYKKLVMIFCWGGVFLWTGAWCEHLGSLNYYIWQVNITYFVTPLVYCCELILLIKFKKIIIFLKRCGNKIAPISLVSRGAEKLARRVEQPFFVIKELAKFIGVILLTLVIILGSLFYSYKFVRWAYLVTEVRIGAFLGIGAAVIAVIIALTFLTCVLGPYMDWIESLYSDPKKEE